MAQTVLLGLEWDQANYPISIYQSGGNWVSSFDSNTYLPDSALLTTYYVDFATGSDANNGTTTGTKLKSIHAAVTKGNATSQPFKVIVTAGTYPRANSLTNSNAVLPTQSCAIVATGGRVVEGNFDDLTWTGVVDATFTNTYKVTRSNVHGVYDLLNDDTYGDNVELTRVADATTCNTTPGSYAQVGADLYVRRADGAVVSNANTRAMLQVNHFTLGSAFNGKRLYLNGIDMEGGYGNATLYVNGAIGVVIMAEDCTFKYAGRPDDATYTDSVAINDSTGFFVFRDCIFAKSSKDGLNFHDHANPDTNATWVLTERCIGRNVGKGASTSNNALTGHGNTRSLDVRGNWTYGRGGTVRFIDRARLGMFGSRVAFDLLDSTGDPPIIIHAAGSANKFWLVDCQGEGALATDYVLDAYSGCIIYTRNFNKILGQNFGDIRGF